MKRGLSALAILAIGAAACNDAQLATTPDDPVKPVAVITSAASSYATLDTAQLDGSESYDPDNEAADAIAQYKWSMATTPPGSSASVSGSGDAASLFIDVAGTYVVQLIVVDRDGLESDPAEFTIEGIPYEDIHIELAWDIDVSDVDLHLVHVATGATLFHPNLDCYFGNCVTGFGNTPPDWQPPGAAGNPRLDLDDVEGYGPENINLDAPNDGSTYKVVVHYWSDDGLGSTNVNVKIYLSGSLQYEAAQNLSATGRTWDVANLDWPSGSITPLGAMYDCDPAMAILGGC